MKKNYLEIYSVLETSQNYRLVSAQLVENIRSIHLARFCLNISKTINLKESI